MAVPFLTDQLGPGALLAVEIAWGADLMADSATWTWVDITTDVRQDPGITTTLGRDDEASTAQPATCTMTLDNSTGAYSLGGQSPNWPNVRHNTPVRLRLDPDGGGLLTVFFGYATGFTPEWNLPGTVQDVKLTVAGTLRRLIQGNSPLLSSLRRGLLDQPDTVAYWPCEDGKNAAAIAPAVGVSPMAIVSGAPKFEASTLFDCSAPLPEINGAVVDGTVGTYVDTGRSQVRMLLAFPVEDAGPDLTSLFRVFTTGTAVRWDALYTSGGGFQLRVYDRFQNLLHQSPNYIFDVNGTGRFYSLEMTQDSPSGVSWEVGTLQPYESRGFVSGYVSGATAGTVSRVIVNPDGVLTDTGFGHVLVQNDVTNRYDTQNQLDAHNGELSFVRYRRLCEENDLAQEVYGDGTGFNSPADRMGPQLTGTVVDLLREVETVDQGAVFDGTSAGLRFETRRVRENRLPHFVIDAVAAKLASPFGPVDDDQRIRNRVEAKRSGGSSAVVEDVDGPLGVNTVGLYDTSITVNSATDEAMPLYAGWLVALGTLEGYRYPELTVDLLATPELARRWLTLRPGYRVDVTGLDQVLPGHPGGTLSLIVEGLSNDLTGSTWTGTARCSPYAVWRIGTVAAPTGDIGEYVARAVPGASGLAADRAAGATSLSVSTTAGPLWTTAADDYPLDLDVGGIPVRATSCTGTGSPQTFTVDPLPLARAAGVAVTVREPTRIGL